MPALPWPRPCLVTDMAKLERTLSGDFDAILRRIDEAVMGGSQAAFFKLNTFGEEAFLDTLRSFF